ncbi:MAG TPA: divalent metal cation transporter [Xanthobacteraceae bacterium]|nr:divalent metal cation transporter [Xanthobacteraceae bacterium]
MSSSRTATALDSLKIHFTEMRAVFGPAWLVMMADVDAASVITAMQSGASYKYGLVLILIALVIPLYFIMEVAGRLGAATKKGLGELVRENFSTRTAVILSLPMAITDFLSYVAEYAAMAVGLEIIGIPPIISLPIIYAIHILVVFKQEYEKAEKYLLAVSFVMLLAYIVFMGRGMSAPYSSLIPSKIDKDFLFLVAANVGAVVMPFMLFYQTTATAKKGFHSVKATRTETLVGAIFSEIMMVAIVFASVGLSQSLSINDNSSLSTAIHDIGGTHAAYVFAIGLVAAGFLGLVVISLAGSWGVVEALNLRGNTWFKIYIAESLPAVILVFFFNDLIGLVLTLMVALIFVLIGPVVAMGLLAQNKTLMGKHALGTFDKIAFWGSVGAVVACGLLAFV